MIVESDRTRTVYNWLQYFAPEKLEREFVENGFSVEALFPDVAGTPYNRNSSEFAVIAKKALSGKMLKTKDIVIRKNKPDELDLLEDLLYAAVYQPDTKVPIPRSVIHTPEVRVYRENFGQKPDDYLLVADWQGQIIGGVWVRVLADEIKGYGNIDDKTPEFAISVFKEYQNQGIGTLLMENMISYLTRNEYSQASLSVQKQNYAVKMYKNLGFEIVDENEEDFIMVLKIGQTGTRR